MRIVFPDYLAMLPLLRAVYLQLREDPITLMRSLVAALPVALAALAWWLLGARVGIVPAVLGAGLRDRRRVQGKGYLNHAYPAAALGFLASGVLLSDDRPFRQRRAVGLLATVRLAMLKWHAFSSVVGHPGLAQAVAQVAPPHPRMIALSDEISVGHPLVRHVAGRWVGRSGALWATGGVAGRLATGAVAPDERQRLDAIAEAEADAFVADVRQGAARRAADRRPLGRLAPVHAGRGGARRLPARDPRRLCRTVDPSSGLSDRAALTTPRQRAGVHRH